MTEMTQIEAGREVDRLVAVEVMGYVLKGNPRGHMSLLAPYNMEPVALKERGREWSYLGYQTPRLPAYSTTGDGMLAVLERMQELGWSVNIESPWQVVFDKVTLDGFVRESASADTLPHAVCLAALEAVRA